MQSSQEVPATAPRYLPVEQKVQTLIFAAEYFPTTQSLHALARDWPVVAKYLPAEQSEQLDEPVLI